MYFPDLIEEYKQLLQQMKDEGVTSGDMYREVKQAIEWMETGYDPAEHRAATRTDTIPIDPYHMQTYMSFVNEQCYIPENMIIECEMVKEGKLLETTHLRNLERVNFTKWDIQAALKGLTENEKAAFIAIKAERMPFSKVAKMLGVTKSTVQSYYNRARVKIVRNVHDGVQENIFYFAG